MSKIIDIFTRRELTQPAFSRQTAIRIASYLMAYKTDDSNKLTMEERMLCHAIMKFIANAAALESNELLVNVIAKIKVNFGDAS